MDTQKYWTTIRTCPQGRRTAMLINMLQHVIDNSEHLTGLRKKGTSLFKACVLKCVEESAVSCRFDISTQGHDIVVRVDYSDTMASVQFDKNGEDQGTGWYDITNFIYYTEDADAVS